MTQQRILLFLVLAGMTSLTGYVAVGQSGSSTPDVSAVNDASNLPVVFLDAKGQIVSDQNQRVPCTVKIVCPKGSGCGHANRVSGVVRIHGATSQGYPKKSYALTLDAPAPLLDLREDRHWILNAAYIDRSLMRHKLSYDLFRSLTLRGSPRFAVASRFVEVSLNGSYNGAYLLMERVDRPLFGLPAYRSNDVSHACIYKAIDHAANFGQPGHAGFEQREPDPTAQPYWQPLDEFNRFVSLSSPTEFFHPQTGIESRLDLDNAIDFHLLVLLTSNVDGITKNFFLARNGPEPGLPKPKFFFAPWDYDGTFGRNWDATEVPPSAWQSNNLFDRLLNNPGYQQKFAARWNQLRDREFSAKKVQDLIDANARTLGDASRRNAARWPADGGPYPDRLTFEEDVAQMKAWIAARIKWLDQEISRRMGPSRP